MCFIVFVIKSDWVNEDCRPPADWPDKGVVQFERFDLRYRENLDLALHGIECDVKQGEKVGKIMIIEVRLHQR